MTTKLEQAIDVSFNYLVGNTDIELNKEALSRVQEITQCNDEEKNYIFVTIDAIIRDFKNKHALCTLKY